MPDIILLTRCVYPGVGTEMAHLVHLIEHNPPGQRLMVVCSDKQTIDMLTELLKDKQVDVTIVNLADSSAQNTP